MDKRYIINLSDAPTLPHLIFIPTSEPGEGLRIIESISVKFRELGTLLLDDKHGDRTDMLVANHPNDVNQVTHAIFKQWLTSRGRRPLSWSTLTSVLDEIGLKPLARDIKKLAGIDAEILPSLDHSLEQSTSKVSDVDMNQMEIRLQVNCSTQSVSSIEDVRAMIKDLKKKFSALKEKIRQYIEDHNILVARVADVLTSLSPDEDEHNKLFVESHVKDFVKAENHFALFLTMNSHWNYLDPSLLNHLVDELELHGIKPETESYKSDLKQFRKKTPLTLFLQTQRKKRRRIPPGFTAIVAEFTWPKNVMLDDVEEFRQEYASHYGLHECAMMLIQVLPGSYIAVWLIPDTIVEKLKGKLPTKVLTNHKVRRLIVNGTCVYSDQVFENELEYVSRSNPVTYESYSICDEDELSEEETPDHQTQTIPSSTLTRKLSVEPGTQPLAIPVLHITDHTSVPEPKDNINLVPKVAVPLRNLGECSPLTSTVANVPVTKSKATSFVDVNTPAERSKATKVFQADPPSLPPTTSVPLVSSSYVQVKVKEFKKRFRQLKKSVRDGLIRNNVAVQRLAHYLQSMPADDVYEHKLLTENHVEVIQQAVDHYEVIGNLGFNMNYISYQLLESISSEFDLQDVIDQIQVYKRDLAEFRLMTPATQLSNIQQKKQSNISPDFQELVTEFKRPSSKLPLETFYKFQEKYAGHYQLSDSAMIFGGIRIGSSVVTATWFVPISVAEKLKQNAPKVLLNQYHIRMLRIAGACVYRSQVETDEFSDYLYVEEPSEDFFCPVTYSLLLYPCITSCCRKNLSVDGVMMIKTEEGACPLCRASNWEAVVNWEMQRRVRDIHVFCQYEDRGCRWQGELRDFKDHVSNCSMRNVPQLVSLLGLKSMDGSESPTSRTTSVPPILTQPITPMESEGGSRRARSVTDYAIQPLIPTESAGVSRRSFSATSHVMEYVQSMGHKEHEQWDIPSMEVHTQRNHARVHFEETADDDDKVEIMDLRGDPKWTNYHYQGYSHSRPRNMLNVQCHEKEKATYEISRGSATTDGQFVYLTPYNTYSLYQYECATGKWKLLPQCLCKDSMLAMINGELNAIGGYLTYQRNELTTLRQGKWVEVYPPMQTGRSSHAVVATSDGRYLFAIGGFSGSTASILTDRVELLEVKSKKWYSATDLPKPLFYPSAAICGDSLNVIGTASGFSCCLKSLRLLASDLPISSPLALSWIPLPPLPVECSTAASFGGELVLLGGLQGPIVNSIYQLVDGKWMDIGFMAEGRWNSLAVSPSPNTALIFGGNGAENSVEECTLST